MPLLKGNVQVSVKEYLEGEQHSQIKHEYVRGHVYAMVGASKIHNSLTLNIGAALKQHLRGSGCNAFVTDVKVRIDETFYYPDALVTCSAADNDPYYSSEPVLIVEVLSPATERVDRLEKRLAYQSLASLQEYMLVTQSRREVEIFRRTGDSWNVEVFTEGETVRLASVDYELPIAEIYEGIAG